MLTGKTVVLGVTGGIAAYKIPNLASMLVKLHADVHVIMTQNATNFITPITFETLTGNKCLVDTFDRNFQFHVAHVSLAKKADIFMVAPATANVIGKVAHGIADDMLTTTLLATKAPIIIAPAMNTNMYENAIVQDNLKTLKAYGMQVIEPAEGYLACGDTGAGKMPEPEQLLQYILKEIAFIKDLAGKKVVVSAGPTRESLDPVRFITNHSTGKMGYAIARNAMRRGAMVTLVSGPVSIEPVPFVHFISVGSAEEMKVAMLEEGKDADYIFMTAAVADYTPVTVAAEKIKKKDGDSTLELKRTTDILKTLGERKTEHQLLCGFSMETENLIENSTKKLEAKNVDVLVANSLRQEGAGFGGDTNVVTFITKTETKELDLMSKDDVAKELIDYCIRIK